MSPNIIILQDTREQTALTFNHKYIKDVRIEKLNFGDYGAELGDGRRLPLYFERKTLNDLWGSLTQGYDRFKQEFLRAKKGDKKLVVIVEYSLSAVSRGNSYSNRSSQSLLAQIFYLRSKYDLETVFCNNPDEASAYIAQSFIALAKYTINSERGKG